MKRTLLTLILGGITLILKSQSNCFLDFKYSTPINIQNSSNQLLDSIQIKLTINTATLISAGKMQANGDDIRFSFNDACCTEIPYYIESGINTSSTEIWIKVPQIQANSTKTISLIYGNKKVGSHSNPSKVFDIYEGFDGNSITTFSPITTCYSTITATLNNGVGNLSWIGSGLLLSNKTINSPLIVKAEAKINSTLDDYPSLLLYNEEGSGTYAKSGYGVIHLYQEASVSVSGPPFDYCQGVNYASPSTFTTNTTGIWSISWGSNGDLVGEFPGIPTYSLNNSIIPRTNSLKVLIGGPKSGTGNMAVDWIRAYKVPSTPLAISYGAETNYVSSAVSISSDSLYICDNSPLNIQATPGFVTYQWNTYEITSNINVIGLGWYKVTAVNANGCISKDSVYATYAPSVNFNLDNDFTICPNSNTIISSPLNFTSYLWSTGETTSEIIINEADSYSVVVVDQFGCSHTDTVIVDEYPNVSSDFNFNYNSLTEVEFTSNNIYSTSYSWNFGDGATSLLPNPIHNFISTGTYQVCLTTISSDGCESTSCDSVIIAITSIETAKNSNFTIYPNPSNGILLINIPNNEETYTIKIIDMSGREVYSENQLSGENNSIDISKLAKGTYTLVVKTATAQYNKTIVKH